jgi:hypothetical protein
MKRSAATLPLVALATLALVATACSGIDFGDSGTDRVAGSGTRLTETRAVGGFDRIVLAGEGDVVVTTGAAAESLTIESDGNLLDYIESKVSGDTLTLSTRRGTDIDPSNGVTYRVDVVALAGVELSGAGSITVDDVRVDAFDVRLAGAGVIDVSGLDVSLLDAALPGAGTISLAGTATTQDVELPGAGRYDAGDLASASVTVASGGAVAATVWATDELSITSGGVGSISYYGNPSLDQRVTGTASVERLGDK